MFILFFVSVILLLSCEILGSKKKKKWKDYNMKILPLLLFFSGDKFITTEARMFSTSPISPSHQSQSQYQGENPKLQNLISQGGNCMGNISVSEYRGLQAFFSSTGGGSWMWNLALPTTTQWQFHTVSNISNIINSNSSNNYLSAPCAHSWQGLQCAYTPHPSSTSFSSSSLSAMCVIQNITLTNMNLIGSLPASLSLLSNLQAPSPSSIIFIFCRFLYCLSE